MTKSSCTPDPDRGPAPEAIGDVIPGEPPVPISTWYVPPARGGDTLSLPMAKRLVANYTYLHDEIIDRTVGSQLARAAMSTRRRSSAPAPADTGGEAGTAALVVSGWPAGATSAEVFMAECAVRLKVGGYIAVVHTSDEVTLNQRLIEAARASDLTYLQHIVAAHDLPGPCGAPAGQDRHVRVHTDILIFSRPGRRPTDA